MNIPLPAPIETYLQADEAADESLFASCFAADAEVHDEGRTIRGLDAIQAWKREAKKKYQYKAQALSASQDGDTVVLKVRLTGNFPGSPIQVTYTFVLQADRIASLKIG